MSANEHATSEAPCGTEAVPPAAVHRLERALSGRLLGPSDPGYDAARRVFNAMIDRHPALIARCQGAEDVSRCVLFAREHGLAVSVKSGGHGVAGRAVCDGGLVIDVSQMKRCEVDRVQRRATVQPGLTLGELDRATQAWGLATPTGVMSGTGLAGLALGGGLGWLNGMYGLTCDNLVAAEVVTSTGKPARASSEEHPDLLWGLRGAGGNLGVVTSLTFQLHPVGEVFAGALSYPAEKAKAAMTLYRDLAARCPDELSANASLSLTSEWGLQASVAVCHAGARPQCERLLVPLRRLGPSVDDVCPMPYLELQRLPDEGYPTGQQHYWRSGQVTNLSDELIEVLIDYVRRMPSQASGVGLQQLHGAAGRVDSGATAYAHRGDRYDLLILSQWPDRGATARNVAWTRDLFGAIEPFLTDAVYVNNLSDDEDEGRVRRAYGGNYERLVAVKTRYDPMNFFAGNQNVAPVSQG